MRQHRKKWKAMWAAFEEVARECHFLGGRIVIEWPRNCTYWKEKCVLRLIKELGLERVDFDGCALGLVTLDDKQTPIKKPWTLYTNSDVMLDAFSTKLCPGPKEHPFH